MQLMDRIIADIETSTYEYATRFSGPVGEWLLEVQAQLLREAFRHSMRGHQGIVRILDVGGGHLQIARAFRDEILSGAVHYCIQGSDDSTKMQWNTSEFREKVQYEVGDLFEMAIPPGSFNAVFCIRLLPHYPEWRSLIGELCRIASRAVIVDYPPLASSNVMYPIFFPVKKLFEKSTRTFALFSHREVTQAFETNGFGLCSRKGQFFLPMVGHRALKMVDLSRNLEKVAGRLGLREALGNPTIAAFVKMNAGRIE